MRRDLLDRLVPTEVEGDCISYGDAESGRPYCIFTITSDQDYAIHDPRYLDDGLTRAAPESYGLSAKDVDEIIAINSGLITSQNEIVDQLAASIQTALGVKNGDLGSVFFSNDDAIRRLQPAFEVMVEYAKSELAFLCEDLVTTKPGAPGPSM